MSYKKTYYVEELTCPNCAMHVVEDLEKLDYINEVHIDYDKKEITIIGEKKLTEEQVNEVIHYILENDHCEKHTYEHLHHIVTEEFSFVDIDCPNCAAKVERALNKDDNIIEAQVNFMNKKIIIKHLNNVEIYDVVSKIVRKIEGDATVFKNDEEEHEEHEHHHDHDCCCGEHHEQELHYDHEHRCCCGEHHNHKPHKNKETISKILLIVGAALFVCALVFKILMEKEVVSESFEWPIRITFILSYIMLGYQIIWNSIHGIVNKDFFNENLLMVIASLGALIIDEPVESIMVILLYRIGEYLQDKAVEKSRNSIQSLMELKVDTVTLADGHIKNVKEVHVGDIISVKVGERIPLDGVIKNGSTDIDMKALTGESRPVYINEGEEILSGSINLTKVVEIEVTKEDSDSTISKVMKLVEEASNQKSNTEKFITKFARYYTPCVLIVAIILTVVQAILGLDYKEIMNNVFLILVISCPCALVISIPLSYFAGIGRSSAAGILVKGGSYLDDLTAAKTFVFDKTGTITKGNFKVAEVAPASGKTKEEVLKYIAMAEQYSAHPIAQSIKDAVKGSPITSVEELNAEELSGLGLRVTSKGRTILVGNRKLMEKFNINYVPSNSIGTIVYLSVNGEFYGSVCIRDEIKETSKELINELNKNYDTVMLTGDTSDVAGLVAKEVGIKTFKSQLLPKEKYEELKNIIASNSGKTVYVGDGINDTPSLKVADIGIAMGGVGSDSAKECADIVIANDDLTKVNQVIQIAKRTRKITTENIVFALTVKVIALVLSFSGILGSTGIGMLIGEFADVGVCLIAILNSMRILKMKIK